jgi:hypothetical protein
MGLFGIFKRRSLGSSSDRILTPSQIREILEDDYGSEPEAIIFVIEASGKMVTPVDMMLVPFATAEFSKDAKLGMVYGTGSGCALIRKTAIKRVQALHHSGAQSITSCQDFMNALRQLGFTVRQDPRIDLDLLPSG